MIRSKGEAPTECSRTIGFDLNQGHFKAQYMESLKNVCPALTGGRERITLTQPGGKMWTTGKVGLSQLVVFALAPWF